MDRLVQLASESACLTSYPPVIDIIAFGLSGIFTVGLLPFSLAGLLDAEAYPCDADRVRDRPSSRSRHRGHSIRKHLEVHLVPNECLS